MNSAKIVLKMEENSIVYNRDSSPKQNAIGLKKNASDGGCDQRDW